MPFDAGTRLGPYEIIAPLGAGGMGEVYRARDTRLDRTVAIKVLTGALAADAESRRRFEQEARAIAALNDPHICTIHDVGHQGDLDYLVLEHLEGETLSDRLRQAPDGLPIGEALEIAIQIGDALDRAHRAGIVHRDLKPGNVMLMRRAGPSGGPHVKLLDFGLAARTSAARPQALDASLMQTMAPSMLATRPPTAQVASGFSGTVQYTRNLARRITDGPPADAHPVWDPDGQHIVFNSGRFPDSGGPTRQLVAGGKPEPVFAKAVKGVVLSWTRDRGSMLLRRDGGDTGADLIGVATTGEPREVVIAQSRYDETEGQFSPDGHWVAFVSNESGRPEVFVQSFPDARARTQVSTQGGTQVRWSYDGKEIFYLAPDGRMMAVPVAFHDTAADVKLPAPLFQTHLATGTNVVGNKPQYAVSRDGRFLLNTAVESPSAPIVVWVNWMTRLAKPRP